MEPQQQNITTKQSVFICFFTTYILRYTINFKSVYVNISITFYINIIFDFTSIQSKYN